MSKKTFGSSEYKRINGIVESAIKLVFKSHNFLYDNNDMEEAVSQTILRIVEHWDSYDETISRSMWFSIIARHCASTYMSNRARWNKHHVSMIMEAADDESYEMDFSGVNLTYDRVADSELISSERVIMLNRAIEHLGDKVGCALMMQSQGYSLAEIQEHMGMNSGALRTMMSRGRDKLAQNREVAAMYAEVYGHNYKSIA